MKNPRSLLNYFLSGQKITRHSFFLFLGHIFYNLVSLIILFFITRRYTPNEVGIYLFAFGEKFLVSSKALFVLSLSIPFIFINKLNATALFSVNLEKWPVYILISGAFINVVLNALVIPQYGFVGAAVTTVITEIVIFAVLGWMFYRRYWIVRE